MEHFKPSSRRKATVKMLLGKNVTAASASMRPKQLLKTEIWKAIWGLMCAACDSAVTDKKLLSVTSGQADVGKKVARCVSRASVV